MYVPYSFWTLVWVLLHPRRTRTTFIRDDYKVYKEFADVTTKAALFSQFFKHPECWSSQGWNPWPPSQQTGTLPAESTRWQHICSSGYSKAMCKQVQQLPTLLVQQFWKLLCLFAQSLKFDRLQTLHNNSQQHTTACNRTCKRSCWPTMLCLFAWGNGYHWQVSFDLLCNVGKSWLTRFAIRVLISRVIINILLLILVCHWWTSPYSYG